MTAPGTTVDARGARWGRTVLRASLVFLAFGGVYGGIAMLADPSGGSLGMDTVLPSLPVSDYVLPGLFLLTAMGVLPLVLAYGLWAGRRAPATVRLGRFGTWHWAWLGSVALGVVLVAWLLTQGLLIGFRWPIQYVTAANAAAILGAAFTAPVRRSYRAER